MKPVVIGCRTDNFSENQLKIFHKHQPIGMIIFAEPFKKGPETARHVINQFKSVCVDSLVFIDAEGGQVNRLKSAFGFGWRDIPPARAFAKLALKDINRAREAIYLNAQLIAYDLVDFGITVNCAPMADLVSADVVSKVGDDGKPHPTTASFYQRSFGDDPEIVAACAKAFIDGLASLGMAPIVKHVPGYGRVSGDPHYAEVGIATPLDDLRKTDFAAFRLLNDVGAMMTGHVIYDAIDHDNCSTLSPKVIKIIRRDIGFKGVLIADTIEMNAIWPKGFSKTEKDKFGMGLPLPGTLTKVVHMALDAGCDIVMHSDCSRDFSHTIEILEAAPVLNPMRAKWMHNNLSVQKLTTDFNPQNAAKTLAEILIPA